MTRINTNVSSLVARNTLGRSNAALEQSLTRLSTGLRINTGKDDPAGLIASENLRSDITSIQRAISNTDRANQVIATADSALGQVSSLLNDIRGLVTESANAGALSDAQLAANQLQVDSSLEALNRIAQTTTFQGRRLLDGSLDFITTAGTGFSNISNLQIDQANLGATGSVAVSVNVTAAATKAQVDVVNIPAGTGAGVKSSTTVTFSTVSGAAAATGTVDFTVDTVATDATADFDDLSTAVSGTLAFNPTGDYTNAAGNDLKIVFAEDSGSTTHSAVYTALTNTITITVGTDDGGGGTVAQVSLDDIFSGLSGDADFTDQITYTASDVTGNYVVGDDDGAEITFSGGADAGTATQSIDIASLSDANGGDLSLTFVEGVTAGVAAGSGAGEYTITYTAGASLDDIIALLEDGTITELDAAATGVATGSSGGSTVATAGGPSGAQEIDGYNAGTTSSDVITISAATAGTAGDGKTVTVQETATSSLFDATTGVGVAVDGSGNITISLDASKNNIAISDIVAAIEATAGYEAVLTTSGSGVYNSTTATPPTGIANTSGGANAGGISAAVVLELAGATGAEVLSFGAGTSIADLVTGINLVKDATGVEAVANGTTLELKSTAYGKKSVVDLKVISEGATSTPTGTFTTAIAAGSRDEGTDVVATVNGVSATGYGNQISINTATLDLGATLAAGFTGTASFTIAGGGALFQLGPDVVSNQQARLGIGSVNTARLGGASGKLFQLGAGGIASLGADPNTAAKIVSEAINQVTSLRGRLGAFQRTSLETNKTALSNTLTNLTDAESSIRDADFAVESAALTRAQILVQSGTTVLQIANQNPQNVLALLR